MIFTIIVLLCIILVFLIIASVILDLAIQRQEAEIKQLLLRINESKP